ncbi:AcrR family transcriptional regulator [Arthrobacter ginsengisoli]|uniref:AcrR family transcriptional regulator n=1 Tax=Arthrobacter ginsengisoli TaxID=1356565 RepID=A0ABU1UBG7_9MICC|nr:TetR family transcriptional regulator [Arthrobacter ginsengisoli]MDR7082554.1 AcrR family transcriptional regulator [Arthrobacter ginsengisoli]
MSSPSHEAILRSASYLFGERGYRAVTVRDIAAKAGVSAALVIKQFRSKEKLFAAVQPDESTLAELDLPTSELGRALVFRVLMRRERGLQEPWATIPFAVLEAPSPDAARADIRERYLAAIAGLIGDRSADRRFASTVITLMIGFGESIRTLGLYDGWNFDDLASHYGAVVQTQIDACMAATLALQRSRVE